MQTPPDIVRAVTDGAFESVFVVLSNGIIWHMNESSRQMFHVISAGANDGHTHVSTYLSFCKSHATNHKKLEVTWGFFLSDAGSSTNEKWIASAVGTPTVGENIPLSINLIRVKNSEEALEVSNTSRTGHQQDKCYYVLYMSAVVDRDVTLQRSLLEAESERDACEYFLFPFL